MARSSKPPVRSSREVTAAAKPGAEPSDREPAGSDLGVLEAPTIGAERRAPVRGPFELGSVIAGRYRILELLGEGGMGAVYRARDLTLGAEVALKVMDPAMSQDSERVDYFRNEVLLARRVTHGNVCRLYDIASSGEHWFITMEYVRGESLADRIRREPPIDLVDAERIVREVASGLAAAHDAGVVHRDLKPDNILLADDGGRAVVADFGIAIEVNQLGSAPVDRAGTRGYMSPEQAAGKEIDARTDVFALGVLAHRMVTGELPWVAPTRVTSTDIDSTPPTIKADIPGPLSRVIDRCLQPKPEHRPADARAVLRLLDGRAPPRRRAMLGLAAILVIALGVAGAAVVGAFGRGHALMFRAPRVVITGVDVSALDEELAWLELAFARRLVNELDDAWGVSGRMWTDPGAPAGAQDISVAAMLGTDDDGKLAVTLEVAHPRGSRTLHHAAQTLQGLAEGAARNIATVGIPAQLARPNAQDLAEAGGHSVEAWRLFRRSQRASMRQEWARARVLSIKALELDPTFVAGNLEYAWTFDASDHARFKPLSVAIETAGKETGLGYGWARAVDFARADFAGDENGTSKAISEVLGASLGHRQRWYFGMRIFAAMWFSGPRAAAVPKLEMHVETFSRLSGAAKLLANHYVNIDGDAAAAQALRFARIAVANGPDDIGARAELGHAEARAGNRAAALAQLAIVESADADEKRYAFAGGEETNSIFDLHIALGDFAGAEQAARRLYNGNTQQQGHAADALAKLALFRGDLVGGRRLLEDAIEHFEKAETTGFREKAQRRRVWTAFALEDYAAVVNTLEDPPTGRWSAHYHVLKHISLHRLAGSPPAAHHLDGADEVLATISEASPYRAFLELMLAVERRQWKAALSHQDLATRGREYIASYLWLGRAAEALGDLDRAATWYETLANHRFSWTEPLHSADARLAAARVRERLGEQEKAIEHYRTYLARLDLAPPSHRGVALARGRLAALDAR